MNENEPAKMTPRPIGERLKELMAHYNLNMNSLSVRMQIPSNSVITRVVNDPDRGLSLEYLQKILTTFPQVNAEWLIMDRGTS